MQYRTQLRSLPVESWFRPAGRSPLIPSRSASVPRRRPSLVRPSLGLRSSPQRKSMLRAASVMPPGAFEERSWLPCTIFPSAAKRGTRALHAQHQRQCKRCIPFNITALRSAAGSALGEFDRPIVTVSGEFPESASSGLAARGRSFRCSCLRRVFLEGEQKQRLFRRPITRKYSPQSMSACPFFPFPK